MDAIHDRFCSSILWVLIAATIGFLASPNAHALTVANCTGARMAIEVTDDSGSNKSRRNTSPGGIGNVDLSDPFVSVRLFELGLVQTLRVSAPSVSGRQSYSAVRLSNGQWQLVVGKAC